MAVVAAAPGQRARRVQLVHQVVAVVQRAQPDQQVVVAVAFRPVQITVITFTGMARRMPWVIRKSVWVEMLEKIHRDSVLLLLVSTLEQTARRVLVLQLVSMPVTLAKKALQLQLVAVLDKMNREVVLSRLVTWPG